MQELNLIQSVVYPVAYHTAENLLVSAPTGAGKTNVAMLAIVQLLRSHLTKDSVLDLKSFKIVYLAPMKALAAELATTFAKRLSPLGLKVRECTGDMQLSKQEILETQMLVSTPEKWDVSSRKGSGDATLVTLVKLLIVDEIHQLHEDRGALIEVLVARTLHQIDRCGDMALRELLSFGFVCHHVGMLRQDRTLVERLFADGHIRTLVCTATLAWGANLSAHAVIIKGTRVYKAEKSDFVELDILDVLQ
ncbi:activating signal cointegrator complex subunit 3, partial [Paragonimus westermani]